MLRVIREEESPRPSMRLSTTEELPSIAACRHVEPRKLSGLVRGELDWIVMKALEKDRNRRYETANGLAADLRRYLDDEPVQACPPSCATNWANFCGDIGCHYCVAAAFMGYSLLLATGGPHTLAGREYAAQAGPEAAVTAGRGFARSRDRAEKARALANRNFQKARAARRNYCRR